MTRNNNPQKNSALVLFSGGQDSSIVLAYSLAKFDHVETIGFDYGQRHVAELAARDSVRDQLINGFPQWRTRLGDDHHIDLRAFGEISETALTRETEIVLGETGLPTTFVPGRNLVFLTIAAALGYRRNLGVLTAGMCETDFSGYPDCRRETLDAQMAAIHLGMEREFVLETPLMHLSKAQSWDLAEQLGGTHLVDLIVEHSHTCYLGERGEWHDWGYGCGHCPACELREKGWREYSAAKA
ncbi:MAG: 7-cyano-7-deazaguanine synthase QueC [Parvularculaceae bacterium]